MARSSHRTRYNKWGALELFVRALNYLQTSSTTIENLIVLTQKEYGKLSEVELTKVLHSKAKALANKEK